MEHKIKRFIELSKEFTINSNKVYEGFENNVANGFTMSGWTTASLTNCSGNISKQPTKLEQFEKAQLEKIAKAKRYEEYLQLQTDLLEFYTAKEKLNN